MDLHDSEGNNKNWNELIQGLDKWHTLVMTVTLLFFVTLCIYGVLHLSVTLCFIQLIHICLTSNSPPIFKHVGKLLYMIIIVCKSLFTRHLVSRLISTLYECSFKWKSSLFLTETKQYELRSEGVSFYSQSLLKSFFLTTQCHFYKELRFSLSHFFSC